MIVRRPLTVKELETIKAQLGDGKTIQEVSDELGRARSVVQRVHDQIKSGEFLKRLAEAQQTEVANKRIGATPTIKATAPDKRRKVIAGLRAKGWSLPQIATKLKLSRGTVSYYYYGYNAGGKKNKRHTLPSRAQSDERFSKILAMDAKGLSPKAIADELGIFRTTVHYYLHKAKNGGAPKDELKEAVNGTGSTNGNGNNAFNRNILIGVAFSETERFIGLLSERLGVPTDVLRPRLSQLLGHSPLR